MHIIPVYPLYLVYTLYDHIIDQHYQSSGHDVYNNMLTSQGR